MNSQFDEIVKRAGTNSVKWDGREAIFGSETALPMWVADMDFDHPNTIKQALHDLIDSSILGYAMPSTQLVHAIADWQKERHHMDVTEDNLLFSPGVVGALAVCVQALTDPKDGVMIHDPVYTPFASVVESNNRTLYRSPLFIRDGQYKMDFDHIEHLLSTQPIKLFLLSNPHNPGGRVWSKAELIKLVNLCIKYQVKLVSDEIHSDLVYSSVSMFSPVTLSEGYKDWVITLHSATKTFNIAGTKLAFYIVYNEEIKNKLQFVQSQTEQSHVSTFGMVATEAAFTRSSEWHLGLMQYLEKNRAVVTDFFEQELPTIFYMIPESTYLFWFDASALNLKSDELKDAFIKLGDIALNDGQAYGHTSGQFMRLNFACPTAVLLEGLSRIKKVFDSRTK
ncbi:MalY/PatB family protein [Marinilactibacillus kalidii]|uniref:MalY/PatB family protein n=1 Tax=Marinilactibacillus kalidii TaxID=2820274 RepID=UPI001ABDB963|nr:MalY/PatB family protein [Marinilactibacillus kalidii]